MSEDLEWPPSEALDFAAITFASIWLFTQIIVFAANSWGYFEQKSILVGIEFCEVFAIILSWIGMGKEAFVSYAFLFLGISSILLATVGLFLTFLRDFEAPHQAKTFKSWMMWTTSAEYLPLLLISLLINNWTLTAYNAIMMIQTPISVSEVINSIEQGFKDGLFESNGSDSEGSLSIMRQKSFEQLDADYTDAEAESEEEEPDFVICGRFGVSWEMIAIFVFGTLFTIGFCTAIIVGAENGLSFAWDCEEHLSKETCAKYHGLDDKFNSETSLFAFAIMLVPTFIFTALYYCASRRSSNNPKYALAVIQCCEIAGMLTSWFQFGDDAWTPAGVGFGICSVLSAVLGLWCMMCTITFKKEVAVKDAGTKNERYELRYACPCECFCCCQDYYKDDTFGKHMAISTVSEFIFYGLNATYHHSSGLAGIFYALVMVRQIFMTERFLIKIAGKRAGFEAWEAGKFYEASIAGYSDTEIVGDYI